MKIMNMLEIKKDSSEKDNTNNYTGIRTLILSISTAFFLFYIT